MLRIRIGFNANLVQKDLLLKKGFRIRMDPQKFELLDPDPDPHTNCGSGSRRAKMTPKI